MMPSFSSNFPPKDVAVSGSSDIASTEKVFFTKLPFTSTKKHYFLLIEVMLPSFFPYYLPIVKLTSPNTISRTRFFLLESYSVKINQGFPQS
ncbi:hypothetical protein ACNR9V_03785 [Parageobacillus thermoglucosidasius]|uniref:hypothetical protein n=1 Tax=Parageobacillus thermoglucosidasius TaxID=1426 RepID=UPI000FFAA209|nr:hypothetical protein [Parageobacillus thermoglucosidasius]GCD81399.1 hypothetical protein PTHTG4_04610 [Parageobacillus thermoglucosidasius]